MPGLVFRLGLYAVVVAAGVAVGVTQAVLWARRDLPRGPWDEER